MIDTDTQQNKEVSLDDGKKAFSNNPFKHDSNKEQNNIHELDFDRNLDSIISSEVKDFDRNVLSSKGCSLAKKNNGDYKVIFKALDSIYSVFMHEIDIMDDEKTTLISKIKEYRVKVVDLLKNKTLMEKITLEAESQANKEEMNKDLDELNIQLDSNLKTIESIISIKKRQNKDKIDEIKEEIQEREREFIKPKVNIIDLFINSFVSLGLLAYLFFFYSSAGYILLYSVQDAKEANLINPGQITQEIFNPQAFNQAAEKGFSAIIFILLFVFIPLGCALYSSTIKRTYVDKHYNYLFKNWTKILFFLKKYILVIMLDTFIAYKVAKVIFDIDLLSGNTNEVWNMLTPFSKVDFYLVFVMGTVAVFLFEVFFYKVKMALVSSNIDMARIENGVIVNQKKEKIREIKEQLVLIDIEICDIEKQNIVLKNSIHAFDRKLIYIPTQLDTKIKELENTHNSELHSIDNKVEIYVNNIEKDKFPISIDSLNDRINVFLEGWNEWLHNEFAVEKAKHLSELAREEADLWRKTKVNIGLHPRVSNN
ncbi:MAG: hypothetical protein WBG43_01450 [Marinifilaceae bacterium]